MKEMASKLHELWVEWTSDAVRTHGDALPPDLVVKWKGAWKPYDELTQAQKVARLGWARRVDVKGKTRKDPPDPRIKTLVDDFRETCYNINGFRPVISWSKDMPLVKARLKEHTEDEMRRLFDWYLSNEISKKLGCSLSTALSAYAVNRWLQEGA